jgi:hypothetical protein
MRLLPILAGLIALAAAGGAAADEVSDPVPGRPDLSYFHLMRLVVPDLRGGRYGSASGHRMVAFRHIAGSDAFTPPPNLIVLGNLEAMPVPGRRDRLVVLADLGPSEGAETEVQVLALFRVGGAPRLLDVVEVGSDRVVGLRDRTPAMLGPGAPLILVSSARDSASQGSDATDMVFIDHDRFRRIGSVATFGDQGCAYRRVQEPAFSVLRSPGAYRTVAVRVREEVTRTRADCAAAESAPRAGVRILQGRYVWDARRRRYVAHDAELTRLARENPAGF